jgi:hypothetical protein
METLGGWLEINEASRGMHLENSPTIMTVIDNVMFLPKMVEGEDIGNTICIQVDLVGTNICNISGGHDAFVAVNISWMGSLTAYW